MQNTYEVVIAQNLNGVIGKSNKIPWKSPEDFAHFKALTSGHTIVMGRKTFESLGRRLPNREHVVVSRNVAYRNKKYKPDIVVTDLEEIFYLKKRGPIFLIGGSEVIQEAFRKDFVSKIHLTTVFDVADGDTFMPEIPKYFTLESRKELLTSVPELRFDTLVRQST